MTNLIVKLYGVLDQELDALVQIGIVKYGYKREEPKKAWTLEEKKQFARMVIRKMASDAIVKELERCGPQSKPTPSKEM